MLSQLTIRNLALLEDARLELSSGLVVLTGETGAGKSLLLDALGLVLGRRADAGLIRQGVERLSVTASFEGLDEPARREVAALGLEDEEGRLLVRREIEAGGKSRAFVNDHPVSVAALARLGERLVYAHGQNEHQRLLEGAEQRDLLDAFGDLEELKGRVETAHARWREAVSERDALALSEQERAQRLDLYRFQARELEAADLRPEEEAELEARLPQLKNAERLKSLAKGSHDLLYAQEASAVDLARRVQRDLDSLRGLGAPLGETQDLLAAAVLNLEEAAHRIDDFASGVEADPARLEELLSRLDLLGRLKKKYGPTLADVISYRSRVAGELDRLENLEGKTQDMGRLAAEAEARWARLALELSEARVKAGRRLAAAVRKELEGLGLGSAQFEVSVERDPARPTAQGMDQVRFLFSPNPGEGRRPLAETASGGELSRVMLALESALAQSDGVPTMIFDEIDAGVGGALGAALGRKLSGLARGRQVICVTHLASLAACADEHWIVEKATRGDRTRTHLRKLDEAERVEEIARLFGAAGGEDPAIGRRHAKELLEASRR